MIAHTHFPIELLVLTFLAVLVHNQPAPALNVVMQRCIPSPICNSSVDMVTNGQANQSFVYQSMPFDCSLPYIYTLNQSNDQYLANTPYAITLSGLTQATSFTITTIHNNFVPTSSPAVTCSPPTCQITIQNNCPQNINFQNYYDRIVFNIENYPTPLTYYVRCNEEYLGNTFQWGLVIEIVFITILIAVVALYSRAWSLGGIGININIWLIIAFNLVIIIGGIIGFFSPFGLGICLDIVTFSLGILGVAICFNEIIFLLRPKPLLKIIFKINTFEFRILEVISLIVGTGTVVGWWFSENNMIVNDIICICMTVAFIKILKFTSLQIAGLAFLITMTILVILALLIYFTTGNSYNNILLNTYNYPFELQIPTINPVYDQKCSWLPFTSIVEPGVLLSYLRRFDSSRNTTIYLIIATVTFFIGGIAWMFISVVSPVSFPFGLISEPFMFGLVCIFAYRRREIRVLW